MTTIPYKNVNIKDITLSNPEKLSNSYICNLCYNEQPLYIQTPILKVDYIKHDEEEQYIDVEINDKDFIDFMLEIDENNIKYTFDNNENWFNKDIPYEAIENMYIDQEILESDDNKYNMKFKLPFIKNKIQCNIYDINKENIDMEKLNDESNIILILHLKGLKIMKESFYLDCYINQIKLVNNGDFNILDEYAIIDDKLQESGYIDGYIFSEEINKILEEEKLEKEDAKKLEEKNSLENVLKNQIKELKEKLNNL